MVQVLLFFKPPGKINNKKSESIERYFWGIFFFPYLPFGHPHILPDSLIGNFDDENNYTINLSYL